MRATPTKWATARAGTPALRIPLDAPAHLGRGIILDVSKGATPPSPAGETLALLLAQVGTQVAYGFAEKLIELGLLPSHAGVMRVLTTDPGLSQRELSRLLSIIPTRAVVLVNELERRGLVERRWNPDDFRAYVLQLTERGKQMLASVEQIARIHNEQICEGLDDNERRQLASLLSFIAVRLGQTPGVDAGYRRIARGGPTRKQVAVGLVKLRKSSSGGAVG